MLPSELANETTAKRYHLGLEEQVYKDLVDTFANVDIRQSKDVFDTIARHLGMELPIRPFLMKILNVAAAIKGMQAQCNVVGSLRILQCPVQLTYGLDNSTLTGKVLLEVDEAIHMGRLKNVPVLNLGDIWSAPDLVSQYSPAFSTH